MMMTWILTISQYVSLYFVNESHMPHDNATGVHTHVNVGVCVDPWLTQAWSMTHTLPRVPSNVHDQDQSYSLYSTIVVGVYVHRLLHATVATIFVWMEKREEEWYKYWECVSERMYGNISPISVAPYLLASITFDPVREGKKYGVQCRSEEMYLWQITWGNTMVQ